MIVFCRHYSEVKNKLLPELSQSDEPFATFYDLINNLDESKAKNLVTLIHIIVSKMAN